MIWRNQHIDCIIGAQICMKTAEVIAMWVRKFLILYIAFTVPMLAAAAEQIEVSGLLGKKAVLIIDGKQALLAVGEKTKDGIELMAIEADGVRLKIDGETDYYPLGSSQVGTSYTKRSKVQERIYKDAMGMFVTTGTINGAMVNFMVDTGATSIAMNSNTARRIGINYLLDGKEIRVSTAQGVTNAWQIKLDRVRVGEIELRNVDAGVLEGSHPTEVLLGMSFLSRLKVEHQGEVMLLETKF